MICAFRLPWVTRFMVPCLTKTAREQHKRKKEEQRMFHAWLSNIVRRKTLQTACTSLKSRPKKGYMSFNLGHIWTDSRGKRRVSDDLSDERPPNGEIRGNKNMKRTEEGRVPHASQPSRVGHAKLQSMCRRILTWRRTAMQRTHFRHLSARLSERQIWIEAETICMHGRLYINRAISRSPIY